MTAISSELPKQYNDLEQHLRHNASGTNIPSSLLSCSSPKLVLSAQLGSFNSLQNHHSSKSRIYTIEQNHPSRQIYQGLKCELLLRTDPRSRQLSVEANNSTPPMNTEEAYGSLRKATAEKQ